MSETLWVPALIGALTALAVDTFKGFVAQRIKKREEKKALREADFEVLKSTVFETRDIATEYWRISGGSNEQKMREASITGRLTFILNLHADIFMEKLIFLERVGKYADHFYEACTAEEFGSANKPAKPERCTDIEIAAYTYVLFCQRAIRQLR